MTAQGSPKRSGLKERESRKEVMDNDLGQEEEALSVAQDILQDGVWMKSVFVR